MVTPPQAAPPATPASPPPGLHDWLQQVRAPEYELLRELGGGGMSRLYLARERALGRNVVVKVLPPECITDDSVVRFQREVTLTARLQHPNILPVLRAGKAGDLLFYIAPFIEGESLRQRIDRGRTLPSADCTAILEESTRALAFAHARGVVHRDVKPGNILLSDGHAVLADFGIARALVPEPHAPAITLTDTRPGTPAYMAPERPDDPTADLYALAVVGHEMLTGERPAGAVSVASILRLRTANGGVADRAARHLARLIARMLAIRPADRIPSAEVLLRQLASPTRALVSRWSRPALAALLLIAAGSVLAAGGAAFARRGDAPDPARDARIVVLPFVTPAGSRALVGGDVVAQRLAESLAEWRDLIVVDSRQVAQVVSAGGARDLDAALDAARRVRAGWLLWGTADARGDSAVVVATLYDVRRRTATRTGTAVTLRDPRATTQGYRALVSTLLRDGGGGEGGGGGDLPWHVAGDRRRESLAAWRAYDTGRAALAAWKLPEAIAALRTATAIDAQHGPANLWLAQALTWQDSAGTLIERAEFARRALSAAARLGPGDSLRAAALRALAEGRARDACPLFSRLVRADSSDFGAWYGLGDCQSRDRAVVRNARSRSGYAFRSSFAEAARAYTRALEVARGAPEFAYLRLRSVLFTGTNRFRFGELGPARERFTAYPELVGDTVTYIPWPSTRSVGMPVPPTAVAATERNARALRRAYIAWTRLAPQRSVAHAALAEALEATGTLAETDGEQVSAIGEIREARHSERDSLRLAGLVLTEVRLLLKNGDFAAAAALADSGVRGWIGAPAPVADAVASLAALTGRVSVATRLLQRASATPDQLATLADGSPVTVPAPLARERAAAIVRAAMGVCDDALRAMPRRFSRLVDATFAGEARTAVRDAMLAQPLALAFPCTRGAGLAGWGRYPDRLLAMQAAVVNGPRALRAQFDTLRLLRASTRAADVSIEYVYSEAFLLAFTGDTAGALAWLEPSLDGLSVAPPAMVARLAPAAGLVRAMALAAQLYEARGDRASARKWAGAVVTLWGSADPVLQSLVSDMRRIAMQ
ncbi:MAG: serine/threonine-protein kinase [Gemmatimonadaceae bacterium]